MGLLGHMVVSFPFFLRNLCLILKLVSALRCFHSLNGYKNVWFQGKTWACSRNYIYQSIYSVLLFSHQTQFGLTYTFIQHNSVNKHLLSTDHITHVMDSRYIGMYKTDIFPYILVANRLKETNIYNCKLY